MCGIMGYLEAEPNRRKGGLKVNSKGTSMGKRGRRQVEVATALAKLCNTVGPILLNSILNCSST